MTRWTLKEERGSEWPRRPLVSSGLWSSQTWVARWLQVKTDAGIHRLCWSLWTAQVCLRTTSHLHTTLMLQEKVLLRFPPVGTSATSPTCCRVLKVSEDGENLKWPRRRVRSSSHGSTTDTPKGSQVLGLGAEPSLLHSAEATPSLPSEHVSALTSRVAVPRSGIGKVSSNLLETPEESSTTRGPPSSVASRPRPQEPGSEASAGSCQGTAGARLAWQLRRGPGLRV